MCIDPCTHSPLSLSLSGLVSPRRRPLFEYPRAALIRLDAFSSGFRVHAANFRDCPRTSRPDDRWLIAGVELDADPQPRAIVDRVLQYFFFKCEGDSTPRIGARKIVECSLERVSQHPVARVAAKFGD